MAQETLRQQYCTDANLNAHIALHRCLNINLYAVRVEAAARIAAEGAFHIGKIAGLFVART